MKTRTTDNYDSLFDYKMCTSLMMVIEMLDSEIGHDTSYVEIDRNSEFIIFRDYGYHNIAIIGNDNQTYQLMLNHNKDPRSMLEIGFVDVEINGIEDIYKLNLDWGALKKMLTDVLMTLTSTR
jgi:hypothetical protein